MFSINNKIFIIPIVIYTIIIFFSGFYLGKYIYESEPVEIQTTDVKYKEFWKDSNSWATKPILITEFDTVIDSVETEPITIRVPSDLNTLPRVWTGNVSRDDNYNINIGLWNSKEQIYEVNTYNLSPKFYWTHTISTGYPVFAAYNLSFNINPSWALFAGAHYEHLTNNVYPHIGLRITF